MKKFDFSLKEKMCLGWMVLGIVAFVVGLFIKVPSVETEALKLSLQNTSATIMSSALLKAASIMSISVLKYIIIAVGVIVFAFSSIMFAGAVSDKEMYEDLMLGEYEEDFEECSCCDCNSCSQETEEALEEIEEISEETEE